MVVVIILRKSPSWAGAMHMHMRHSGAEPSPTNQKSFHFCIPHQKRSLLKTSILHLLPHTSIHYQFTLTMLVINGSLNNCNKKYTYHEQKTKEWKIGTRLNVMNTFAFAIFHIFFEVTQNQWQWHIHHHYYKIVNFVFFLVTKEVGNVGTWEGK